MGSKRSETRTSAEIIADNDDLLLETILLRLPAEPLIRFQLVCKHWQSLISEPSFSRRRHLKPQSSFIFRPNPPQFVYFNPICRVFYPFYSDSTHMLESRNSKYGQKNYGVYNPTTNQSITVVVQRRAFISGICLAFDPSIRSSAFSIQLLS
ncbi:F-box protein at5g07610 [Phtheirospermum japonicum]|uniref:F-box protein at5g07610 n=1 Tax=Phtheirospermum japonicum TaxID=374723 RepID=A0A830B2Z8_9LAMI|nr:F-box protein at5g07610 [Phtheirospermum japonicum]